MIIFYNIFEVAAILAVSLRLQIQLLHALRGKK